MLDLKKIMKEVKNYNKENIELTQRVSVDIVMEQIPYNIQELLEKEFLIFFDKVKALVPDNENEIIFVTK